MTTLIPAHLHDEQLLTTDQVAHITGIAKPTFEGWRSRKNGGPPHIKLSKQIVRYRWSALRQWMDAPTETA